jgi:hypothetical protein
MAPPETEDTNILHSVSDVGAGAGRVRSLGWRDVATHADPDIAFGNERR